MTSAHTARRNYGHLPRGAHTAHHTFRGEPFDPISWRAPPSPIFLHSLLRYGLLAFLLASLFFAWRGYLLQRPILVGERMATIVTVVLAHVQLLLGLIIYMLPVQGHRPRWPGFTSASGSSSTSAPWWWPSCCHLGRVLAKRARRNGAAVAGGCLLPAGAGARSFGRSWPFTEIGHGREWLLMHLVRGRGPAVAALGRLWWSGGRRARVRSEAGFSGPIAPLATAMMVAWG